MLIHWWLTDYLDQDGVDNPREPFDASVVVVDPKSTIDHIESLGVVQRYHLHPYCHYDQWGLTLFDKVPLCKQDFSSIVG